MRTRLVLAVAGVAAVAVVSGCGSSGKSSVVTVTAPSSPRTAIGGAEGPPTSIAISRGTTVRLGAGARLVVPAGAVRRSARISVRLVSGARIPGAAKVDATPVSLTLSGASKLETPARIEFPYSPDVVPAGRRPEDVLSIGTYEPSDGSWTLVETHSDEARHVLYASAPHFSVWGVVGVASTDGAHIVPAGWAKEGSPSDPASQVRADEQNARAQCGDNSALLFRVRGSGEGYGTDKLGLWTYAAGTRLIQKGWNVRDMQAIYTAPPVPIGGWLKHNLAPALVVGGVPAAVTILAARFKSYRDVATNEWADVSTQISDAYARCPRRTILIAGYSQGNIVLRYAVRSLAPGVRAKISSVDLIGDPTAQRGQDAGLNHASQPAGLYIRATDRGVDTAANAPNPVFKQTPYPSDVASRVTQYCADYDFVCEVNAANLANLPGIGAWHTSYPWYEIGRNSADRLPFYYQGPTPATPAPQSRGGPAAQPAPQGSPRISIGGSCTSAGGTLTSTSSGFTPGSTATIRAWYPDGRPYTNLMARSAVRADGSIRWTWPCAGDPTGTYTTEVTDGATGRSTGRISFTVGGADAAPAPAAQPSPAPGPAPAPAAATPLLSIAGSCTTGGGTLTSASSGFTPAATATIRAWYPDGSPYTNLIATSRVRADGSIRWTWPCAGDPAGTYATEVTDDATGRSTGRVAFTVGASAPAPQPTRLPAPNPAPSAGTIAEQAGSHGAPTFLDPHRAAGPGPRIDAMTWVNVTCKVHAPEIASSNPDGYWYRIASPPWSGAYYAVANTFWNGDVPGQRPYTHNTDPAVRDC